MVMQHTIQMSIIFQFRAMADAFSWRMIQARHSGWLRVCVFCGGATAEYPEDIFEEVGIANFICYGFTETFSFM